MRIDFVSEDKEDKLLFVIDDIDVTFANTLRRTIMMEVPIYACKDVIFYSNSSPLYDEMISLRMGLIPLTTPFDSDVDSKMVTLSMEAEGPSTVYSSSLVSDDPSVQPISDDFPLVKLAPGQSISFNAECNVGFGKDHVKWQAGLASYKNFPNISVDKERCNLCGECVKACPVDILELGEECVNVIDVRNCTFCMSCEEACRKLNEKEFIKVRPEEGRFIFKLESYGCMNAKDLLKTALNVIEKKAKALDQQLRS